MCECVCVMWVGEKDGKICVRVVRRENRVCSDVGVVRC